MKEASNVKGFSEWRKTGQITRLLDIQRHLTHRQKRYVSLLSRHFLYPRKTLTLASLRDFEASEHLYRDSLSTPLAWLVMNGFVETAQYDDGVFYYKMLPEATL